MEIKNFLLKYMCCFRPTLDTDAIRVSYSDETDNNNSIEISKNYDINNTQPYKKFNLDNLKGKYYVKSVYDGDTITILVPMSISQFEFKESDELITDDKLLINFSTDSNTKKLISFYEIRIRIYGIDTPEMKPSKNLPNREEHIKKAHQAKDYLSFMVLNKIIYCEFMQNDKYGRPLAKLYYQNKSISDIMIENGFAKPYDGGTKDTNF